MKGRARERRAPVDGRRRRDRGCEHAVLNGNGHVQERRARLVARAPEAERLAAGAVEALSRHRAPVRRDTIAVDRQEGLLPHAIFGPVVEVAREGHGQICARDFAKGSIISRVGAQVEGDVHG